MSGVRRLLPAPSTDGSLSHCDELRPDCWTMKVKVCTATGRRSRVSHLAPSGQWISPGLCPDELFPKTKIQLQCFALVARKIQTGIKINALQSTYETRTYATIGVCVVMQ